MRVASGGEDFDDTLLDAEHGDIKCAAAKIVDDYVLLLRLHPVKSVGDGGRRGLIDDSFTVEACYLARVQSRLLLRIVEVGRHRDYRILNGAPTAVLRELLHLLQHLGRDLFRMEALLLAAHIEHDLRTVLAAVDDLEGPILAIFNDLPLREPSSNQPFRVIDRICGISCGLVESCGANHHFVLGLEGAN